MIFHSRMDIDHLVGFGFSPAVIVNWKRAYTRIPLPLQARAAADRNWGRLLPLSSDRLAVRAKPKSAMADLPSWEMILD
ncbi:MAG: hypothetical protein WCK47_06330 [bacterium]|nr:hypothetical protein [Candidatus Sumerlaeota bacterium]